MKLITVSDAARIAGISAPLMRFRIRRGDLPVARRNPRVMLRTDVVLRYAAALPAVRSYRRSNLIETVESASAELLGRIAH